MKKKEAMVSYQQKCHRGWIQLLVILPFGHVKNAFCPGILPTK